MAEFESTQERTEPASPKKRSDARKKGSVAKSMDLNSAAVLVFGLLLLSFGGSTIVMRMEEIARAMFVQAGTPNLNASNIPHVVRESFVAFGIAVLPVLLGVMLIGIATNIAQVGFLFTLEPLQPKFSKMNPLGGIKRVMMSKHSMAEMVKGTLKVLIVAFVAYKAVDEVLNESVALSDSDVAAILAFMGTASVTIGLKVGLAFFVLAAADYLFQRFEYEKSLRMTKEEVKEENKQSEGDPLIKGRIRAVQRQIAYRRMMQDVPKADVVVTNPTHYAVAIKYEMGKMNAPKVVAKGVDLIAQRIKEVAKEHDVPIVEDKPLAQMLYKTVEIGDQIPEKLFQAVAQVLAYVYRLREGRRPNYSMN
jgi:flagellar biosynthetic protein FlhB